VLHREQAGIRRSKISTSFSALGLRAELLRALSEQDYQQPTPIQLQAIPLVLAGRDVLGAAQTGTGKTAAFMLPILQRLRWDSPAPAAPAQPRGRSTPARPIRALVLAPTRELAIQVEQSARDYGRYAEIRSAAIYGGVGMQPQIDALRRGVDLVVATPGRLLDHLSQRTLTLDQVTHMVLDEADRMLDMGFIHDVRRVLAALPKRRQTLLFSATFSPEIRRLADAFLSDPATVQVAAANATVDRVSQSAHTVSAGDKRAMLAFLIRQRDWPQTLVFTRTKHGANRLAEQLTKAGIEADAIHGNKSQNARLRALGRFKSMQLRVLVATDIAARGLDIEELPCVVNFDLPQVPEDYVHRIGRTARAGASGEAVSLVTREDEPLLTAIEALIRQKIQRRGVEGFSAGAAEDGRDDAAAARSHNSGGRSRDSAARPRDGGGRSRGNAAPSRDNTARARGNGAPTRDNAARARGNGAPTRDNAARTGGNTAPSRDSAARTRGNAPSHDSATRAHNSAPRPGSQPPQKRTEEGARRAVPGDSVPVPHETRRGAAAVPALLKMRTPA